MAAKKILRSSPVRRKTSSSKVGESVEEKKIGTVSKENDGQKITYKAFHK
ncbi:MAG: hypothetical protein P8Y17_02835 [Patescibacteria group bacterium]